eukprot:CAMPEP_0206174742 /NCGR_PEP_ID=MMETSP1474-20131121/52950_1 /ASSEMBLY_ACC=CAM_ASM_001110 /TAXON_ID=97495 /ORGANISM="Imantonia sp., Strain RCC918" /LENGTH=247 /DNA_ID=CAMNT_0053584497 /DNA_START=283 /DNA_END=1024 /DNA_ORIENTATION=+
MGGAYRLTRHHPQAAPLATRRQAAPTASRARVDVVGENVALAPLALRHFGHARDELPHLSQVLHREDTLRRHVVGGAGGGRALGRHELQLVGPLEQLREGGLQLDAALEERAAAEDVEAEARARHRDHEAADVADVPDRLCAHEREEDEVILLPLELVRRRDLGGRAEEGRPAAALRHDVLDEVLLPVVRRDDRDSRRRDALQPHVHEGRHDVLSLRQVLDVVRERRRLAHALKVADVDQLEGVREA